MDRPFRKKKISAYLEKDFDPEYPALRREVTVNRVLACFLIIYYIYTETDRWRDFSLGGMDQLRLRVNNSG